MTENEKLVQLFVRSIMTAWRVLWLPEINTVSDRLAWAELWNNRITLLTDFAQIPEDCL